MLFYSNFFGGKNMRGLLKNFIALFMVFAMIFTCAPYSLARGEAGVQTNNTTDCLELTELSTKNITMPRASD